MIRLVLVSSFILILGSYETKGAPNDLPLKNDETRPPYRSIEGKGVMDLAGGFVKAAGIANLGLTAAYVFPPIAGAVVGYRIINYGVGKTQEAAGYAVQKTQEGASYAAGYVVEKAQEAALNAVKDGIQKKFSENKADE
ncbi:uncharacterized protein LOC128991106 [Macrosteles quadrilineatus]|uniref:uncharacterized protein LOC128989900 n=1 Tax=Macrosteles quadrilineatus TaxID=74068 RepID=UPI0023E19565|nr:uncharacterized protein LOC128989900 [Macrosteles quadrilineatus]XP_054269811.1 uncharacterized protein LOC128991106 [Macrosteles quadrilineatus]